VILLFTEEDLEEIIVMMVLARLVDVEEVEIPVASSASPFPTRDQVFCGGASTSKFIIKPSCFFG
jgi:hypothetical protein